LQSKGVLTPQDRFKGTVKFGDWNELEITADGNRIIHKLNGVVTLEAIDQTWFGGSEQCLIAVELKRATGVELKNIRLKLLPEVEEHAANSSAR
jgi:hypothetical protein